ncbi:hypothetical protein GCM10029992_54260 [Glycomyces albus]
MTMQGDTGRGGEAADVPGDLDLIRLFRAATAASDRFAERFGASHGLHRTDLNALEAIMDAARRGAPMSPSVLAAETGLSPSATTALIDRLEASGHVERVRTGGDRRRVTLAMSEAAFEGAAHVRATRPGLRGGVERLLRRGATHGRAVPEPFHRRHAVGARGGVAGPLEQP